MTGADAASPSQAIIVARSGFETVATVPKKAVVVVQALDYPGSVSGASTPVGTTSSHQLT